MSRRKKDPLRQLREDEREVLEQIARSHSEPAIHVERSKALLAVADGKDYTQAAAIAGRRSGDAVSQLVSRFNQEGLAALVPRYGGGAPVVYGNAAQARILKEFRRLINDNYISPSTTIRIPHFLMMYPAHTVSPFSSDFFHFELVPSGSLAD
jgi:hypothetical protein